jgi:hypothetical protein
MSEADGNCRWCLKHIEGSSDVLRRHVLTCAAQPTWPRLRRFGQGGGGDEGLWHLPTLRELPAFACPELTPTAVTPEPEGMGGGGGGPPLDALAPLPLLRDAPQGGALPRPSPWEPSPSTSMDRLEPSPPEAGVPRGLCLVSLARNPKLRACPRTPLTPNTAHTAHPRHTPSAGLLGH